MAVVLFKDGEKILVHHKSVQNHLNNGWSYEDGPAESTETSEDVELEAARELYKEQTGKRPHHKLKADTIMEKLKEYAGE